MKKKIIGFLICLSILFVVIIQDSFIKSIAIVSKKPLQSTVIVIDPGHGGKDPGASSYNVQEDIINLSVSLKLKQILTAAGAEVILTRDSDYDLAPSDAENKKREDMKNRAAILNQENVTLFVSIHCNISLDNDCSGAEAYYRIDDKNSEDLATAILDRLKPITDSRFQPKKGDFYLLNNTQTLGALIEIGFLSNYNDAKKLEDEKYQEDIAYGIFQGIDDYLKILQ